MINLSALSGAIAQASDALAENRDLRAKVSSLQDDATSSQASIDALVKVLQDALAPKVVPVEAPAVTTGVMPASPQDAAITASIAAALANAPA